MDLWNKIYELELELEHTGRPALYFGAWRGDHQCVAAVMATPTHLETPISVHRASYRGQVWLLEQLYGGGWSLTARDSNGRTPLHYAAVNGQSAAVKWLVHRNSDLLCMQDKDGWTPLHHPLNGC